MRANRSHSRSTSYVYEHVNTYNPPNNFCGLSLDKTDHVIYKSTMVIRRDSKKTRGGEKTLATNNQGGHRLPRSSLEMFAITVRMCTTIPPTQCGAAPAKRESLQNCCILMADHDLLKPAMFRIILSPACAPNWPCTTPQFRSFLFFAISRFQFSQLQQISLQAGADAAQSIACGQRGLLS